MLKAIRKSQRMFFPRFQLFPITTGSIMNLNIDRAKVVTTPKPSESKSRFNGSICDKPKGPKRKRKRKIKSPKTRMEINLCRKYGKIVNFTEYVPCYHKKEWLLHSKWSLFCTVVLPILLFFSISVCIYAKPFDCWWCHGTIKHDCICPWLPLQISF